jgi:hypothetical protein
MQEAEANFIGSQVTRLCKALDDFGDKVSAALDEINDTLQLAGESHRKLMDEVSLIRQRDQRRS